MSYFGHDTLLVVHIGLYVHREKKTCRSIRHNFGKFDRFSPLDYAINTQRDSCYISHNTLSVSLHYLAKRLLWTHSTFSKLIITFVCVFITNLIFVDPGMINGTYCRDVLLTDQRLPVVPEISNEFFIFQQYSVLHTDLARKLTSNKRHQLSFYQTCGSQKSRSEPGWLQNLGRNAAAALQDGRFMTLMNWSKQRRSTLWLAPNFTFVALEIWASITKIVKYGIFGINLPTRGQSP